MAVGLAAGGIVSMDPNLGVQPFQWIASIQQGISRHWAIEPEVGQWSYGRTSGPFDESVRWTFAGANILARVPVQSASVFGGVGAGLYHYGERRVGTPQGSTYVYEYSHNTVGLQALVGVNLHVAGRLIVFGVLRAQVVPEADLGTTGLHAGVRYAF